MNPAPYTYAECISRSKAASWRLEDFLGMAPDFSKEFMPESLAQTKDLSCLAHGEALRLNQIRGYTYAHIFGFLEEYIIDLAGQLRAEKCDEDDPIATEAFDLFLEEEKKHQLLFEGFKAKFQEGFDSDCGLIEGAGDVSREISKCPRLTALMLTAMIEWLTQEHYLQFFERERAGDDLDPTFRQLFRLHWVEEAQHARLDTLEAIATASRLEPEERQEAVAELRRLLGLLRDLLVEQARLDVESLERAIGRALQPVERDEVFAGQQKAYVHSFIDMALQGDRFRQLVEAIIPEGMSAIETWRPSAS